MPIPHTNTKVGLLFSKSITIINIGILDVYQYHTYLVGTCESEIFVRSNRRLRFEFESRIESGCSRLHVQELCRPTAYYPNATL